VVRHLISIDDLTDEELFSVVCRGALFADGDHGRPLAGQVAGIYFTRTSTRTRTAFSVGAQRLGASIVSYGPDDLQTNTGESIEDTGRVLSSMVDILVARAPGERDLLRGWANQSAMAVVNAMSTEEHPTQALADLTTLLRHFGRIESLRVLYVGEGNNTATALSLALSRFAGVELFLRTPPGYGLPPEIAERTRARAKEYGAVVEERHDMVDLPTGVDVVYTTRWQTTGTVKPDQDWRRVFTPFRVDLSLWAGSPNAVFMHDLPAHRGEEVAAEVLDGPASIAFFQAENKLYSAMAVLDWAHGGLR